MDARTSERPLAIVCGSDSLAGSTIVTRLAAIGWDVITIDPVRAGFHPDALLAVHGEVQDEALWAALRVELNAMGRQPRAFVFAATNWGDASPAASTHALRGAELGCRHLIPLMPEASAAVFITSVLGTWDVRADAAAFGASQAGLLGLMRAQALLGAPRRIRVNAVCAGLVADPSAEMPPDILARIPLGGPAAPDDIADAALFLLSADAGHITGSTLVVDGGQSLQSWSNAPREGRYLPPSTRATAPSAIIGVIPNEVRNLGSDARTSALTPLPPSPIAMGEGESAALPGPNRPHHRRRRRPGQRRRPPLRRRRRQPRPARPGRSRGRAIGRTS